MTPRGPSTSVDVAIVGSGFAGSLAALALRSLGRSVALIERGTHPRFAIGESSTPLANLLLEEICDRYRLDRIRALSKWGTWQTRHPHIGGGLKRGFSFFRHDMDAPFRDGSHHDRQLLVGASPHDGIGDTHWYRPDFDHFLVEEASNAGAGYLDEVDLTALRSTATGTTLEGVRAGQPLQVHARFIIDASGPRGCLHRALGLGERPLQWLPATQALFTHFSGVDLWDRTVEIDPASTPPFPVDDAALHHVFPGGWIWVLRFNNGLTSAGAALTGPVADSIEIGAEGAWDRLLGRLPSIARQFHAARPVRPFIHSRRLAFRSATVSGRNWALLPSAAGVIDPLLSTGFPLTLLGIQRVIRLLESDRWDGQAFADGLADYSDRTQRELDATERLVAALYASMGDFELFKRLSLLYFAAAAFSETSRRLEMPDKARGFLLCDDPAFAAEMRACADAALAAPGGVDRASLLRRIDRAIEPYDVAGLGDRSRRDWYPVLAGDLVAAAPKLDATTGQIDALLERSGFAAARARTGVGS
jgi:tetracycline 7-halogenase / FADH2 O2-dependent halogenase